MNYCVCRPQVAHATPPEKSGAAPTLQPGWHIRGGIRVHGATATLMAGVQCGQQIDDLGTPHLPHHKSVGSHPEGLPDEISQGHRTCSFDVGRSGLKPNDMRMGWIKFAGVLHHQQSLISSG
jgi:hypothetical protein